MSSGDYAVQQRQKSAGRICWSTLFNRQLDTHQTMFAMGEAIAHLNYLEQAGRLSRETDPGAGDSLFADGL